MAGQLSTEQVLLLNNLMYLDSPFNCIDGKNANYENVGDWINSIDLNRIDSNANYNFTSGEEWKNIVNAVKNDKTLMGLEIVATHRDVGETGGGGLSAVFKNPETNEAIVTFKGTAAEEWKDDFVGGGYTQTTDGVSTEQQLNALEWYQSLDKSDYSSITITGHSKGGNKAKYITLMDDSVSRCVSFDGQGFSDEFVEQYRDNIARNQEKIHNNNLDGDFVNILLNDVGSVTYYKGNGVGNSGGGYAENHCPNSFLKFNQDGTYKIIPGPQSEQMKKFDEFLNSCLRSMPDEQKQDALAAIGELIELGLGKGVTDVNEYLKVLTDGSNAECMAYFIAYFIKYEQANPEIGETIKNFLQQMGMDDFSSLVDVIQCVMNWKYFDSLVELLGKGLNIIPDFILDKLLKFLEEQGIKLTKSELKKLLAVVSNISDYMEAGIDVTQSGADLKIDSNSLPPSYYTFTGSYSVLVSLNMLSECLDKFSGYKQQFLSYESKINSIAGKISGTGNFQNIRTHLEKISQELHKEADSADKMLSVLEIVSHDYILTEERIATNLA